jgi:hypothetical protein
MWIIVQVSESSNYFDTDSFKTNGLPEDRILCPKNTCHVSSDVEIALP